MNYQFITYEVDDRLATITFNRPERRNAIHWAMSAEISTALREAEGDQEVRVIILKGAGASFSAGYDLDSSAGTPPRQTGRATATSETPTEQVSVWDNRARVQGHIDYMLEIWNCWKPVIAQVHGYALGGASTIALSCDLTMMADDAKIGYPPTRWLAPGDNVAVFCFTAGLKKAKEMMFGRVFNGKEAADIGMINYSWPADQLEAETRAIARRIATIPPELLMLNKSLANRVWEIIGIKTAMEVGGEFDSLAHLANTARPIAEAMQRTGSLTAALKELNKPWGGV